MGDLVLAMNIRQVLKFRFSKLDSYLALLTCIRVSINYHFNLFLASS